MFINNDAALSICGEILFVYPVLLSMMHVGEGSTYHDSPWSWGIHVTLLPRLGSPHQASDYRDT